MPVPLRGYTSKLKKYDSFDPFKYMSGFGQNNQGVVMPLGTTGNSLTIDNYKSHTFDSTANGILIGIIPSVRGVGTACMWDANTGAYITGSVPNLSPTWRHTTGDSPLKCSTMRCSARLYSTSSQNVARGTVKTLIVSAPVDFQFSTTPGQELDLTTACKDSILESLNNNAKARIYPTNSLDSSSKEIISGPASLINYSSWGDRPYRNGNTLPDVANAFQESQLDSYHMQNIFIYVEPVATSAGNPNVSFCIEIGLQTRNLFEANTVLGHLSKPSRVDLTGKVAETLKKVADNDDMKDTKAQPSTGMPGVPSPTAQEIAQAKAQAKAKPKPVAKPKPGGKKKS